MNYIAPIWLPGGHAQTLYAALGAPRPRVTYRRERWDTPDGDFIDLDWAVKPAPPSLRSDLTDWGEGIQHTPRNESPIPGIREPATAPLVVLFHGLEGSSRSHYALALMHAVRARGWRGVVVHFRGCSGEMNRLPRAYHSGDSTEIDWILRRLKRLCPHAPLHAVGVSLGGNALLKWLGETGASARELVDRATAVSAPVNLMAAGNALDHGLNLVYARHFLVTMKKKALAKLSHHPGLYNAARLRAACTLREFDNVVTAPLHGYLDTDDYWTRASSKPLLRDITVPTLLVNACNDPFLPCGALPAPHEVSPQVLLEQPENGGHVGFMSGPFPGNLGWLPQRILEFFDARDKTTNTTRSGELGQVRQAASDFIDLH
ncbi:MAG: alpha/beta fold hydrolase [Burkholderiales bacterium]|nr:alpha/beta fold hydrolase [Burkholderiales bacterium]